MTYEFMIEGRPGVLVCISCLFPRCYPAIDARLLAIFMIHVIEYKRRSFRYIRLIRAFNYSISRFDYAITYQSKLCYMY